MPSYFDYVADLLAEGMAADWVTSGNWKTHTNRLLYSEHAKALPVTKAEEDAGVSLRVVWKRLAGPVLSGSARDVLFILIHNKQNV